jgi:aspartate aminotransferase
MCGAVGRSAMEGGKTRYTPAAGIAELRAAVAHRYAEDDGVSFRPDEAVITTGGKHALYVACQALLEKGDEVVIPTPHWATFSEAVRLAGGKPVLVTAREKDGFKVSARLVAKGVTARTKAILVNSPSNPTGAVVEPSELLAIGKLARQKKVVLLYDDTYARLLFGPTPTGTLEELRAILGDSLVILGTASKTYCMTGWRIGWVLGGRELVDACTALISHSTQCPAAFAQHAAVCALTGPQDGVREMAAEYRRRRDLVYPAVRAIAGVTCAEPGGGFYVFPNVSAYLGKAVPDTLTLASRLLERTRTAVVPGEGFGAPGYLRISFARPKSELEDGVARLRNFLQDLTK